MPIDKAIWFSDEEHVLYTTNNKMNVIELDERSTKNGYEFTKINAVDFAIDKDGEDLIFLNEANNLFKAIISEENGLF